MFKMKKTKVSSSQNKQKKSECLEPPHVLVQNSLEFDFMLYWSSSKAEAPLLSFDYSRSSDNTKGFLRLYLLDLANDATQL